MVIVAIVGQVLLGCIMGLVFPYALGIGNGNEVVAIPVGTALGVWVAGSLYRKQWRWLPFGFALVGAGLGFWIASQLAAGFASFVIPLALAIVGEWLGSSQR